MAFPADQTVALSDPINPANLATVAQFHNADNQSPGTTAYGLLTGGVAQLLNQAGNLDRQREAGIDGIASVGVSTGSAQFAMVFNTTSASNVASGNATVITPAAMSGTINGVAWSIQIGSVLSLDSGGNQEFVVVTAVTGATFTANTAKAHNGSGTAFAIQGFVYNQERDAAGELDGATGSGTAVAAEYEFNGGGSNPGKNSFDRARSVQAKGQGAATISGLAASGVSTMTLSAAGGVLPGMAIVLTGGTAETVYVATSYGGGTTVPLQGPTQFNHANGTNAYWDIHAPSGPGLTGFTAIGVGIEEEALYDPVSGLFYIERSATQDAMPGANIVAENPALYNGSTFDRQKGISGSAQVVLAPTPSGGATQFFFRNLNATVQSIKASAGTLYGLQISNTQAATACVVQVFNTASGGVTLGTTAPVMEIYVPGPGTVVVPIPPHGIAFGTALSIASTTTEFGSSGSAAGVVVSAQYN